MLKLKKMLQVQYFWNSFIWDQTLYRILFPYEWLTMCVVIFFFIDIKQSPNNPNLYWHVLNSVMWTTVLLTRKQYNISSQPRLWRKNNTEGKVFIQFSLVDTVWVVLDLYPTARSNLLAHITIYEKKAISTLSKYDMGLLDIVIWQTVVLHKWHIQN